jgi:hypothetical protein
MKKMGLAFSIIACFSIIYCSTGKSKEQTAGIQSNMELVVEQGVNWLSKMKVFLFFSKNNSPQLASWIEDNDGNYISTIAISEKSAKEKWISAPKEGRPEALPVWNHRQHNFSVTNNYDTVTSATTKGSFEANINRELLVNGNTYNVFLEINHSFDYNNYWTKNNSGVNGQPSLVYHAQFIAGQHGRISLVPIGHGSVDGSDGNIIRELENFTTALSIIHNATVVIK